MDEVVDVQKIQQDYKPVIALILGAIGIVMLLVSYGFSGILYEMMGDHIQRLPVYDRLLHVGFSAPFPMGVAGLILAGVSDFESKFRKPGMIVNGALLALTLLVPLFLILMVLVFWGTIGMIG